MSGERVFAEGVDRKSAGFSWAHHLRRHSVIHLFFLVAPPKVPEIHPRKPSPLEHDVRAQQGGQAVLPLLVPVPPHEKPKSWEIS